MRVLVTGFEPFGGEPTNPSWEVASRLPNTLGGHEIIAKRLPVEYDRAARKLAEAIAELRPDAVISIGQAGGRGAITPETVAINMAHTQSPDGAGEVCDGVKLLPFGEDGYFTNLDLRRGIEAIAAAGIPARQSYDAGGYVCNAVMYTALCIQRACDGRCYGLSDERTAIGAETQRVIESAASEGFGGMKCGFIHIPFETEQATRRGKGEPSLPLEMMIRGISAYIPAALADA